MTLFKKFLDFTDGDGLVGGDRGEVEGGDRDTVERVVGLFEVIVGEHFVFDAPLFGEEFGDVVSDTVGEDADDSFGGVFFPAFAFDELEGSLDCCTT